MKKNWIIGALMSVILLCATDVVAQDAKQEDAGAVFDETNAFVCLKCNVRHTKYTSVHGDALTKEELKKSIYWKHVYRCPKCHKRWYTTSLHPNTLIRYVEVDDSTKPRHICSKANRCLVEMDSKNINDVEVERTLIRQCESTDTLIVQMDLGSEKRTYQMVGKTLSFRTTYRGNIECEYFAPAQHRSAKKPTTQGTNGKRKRGVMLRGGR
ncbi:MAG: hypothetical protein IJE69_00405 [Alistipes sp.]|nr:hypothetical protein [Alistipes sp.]